MGVVYEAEQESLGRHVALKVLPRPTLLDPRHLARFHREAKAAARLHHTNIVPVFGVGEARRRPLLRHAVHPRAAGSTRSCAEVRRLDGGTSPAGRAASCRASGRRRADLTADSSTPAVGRAVSPGTGRLRPPAAGARPRDAAVRLVGRRRADSVAAATTGGVGRGSACRWPRRWQYAHAPGRPAPRRQAVEPAARRPRDRLGHRLRPGQGGRQRRT